MCNRSSASIFCTSDFILVNAMKYSAFFIVILMLCSCTKKLEVNEFSFQDQGESFNENNFAVINEKYVTSFDIPGRSGIIVAHLRYAEIFKIQETYIVKDENSLQELWIKINDGWVLASSVQIYNNYDKAKTASEVLQYAAP